MEAGVTHLLSAGHTLDSIDRIPASYVMRIGRWARQGLIGALSQSRHTYAVVAAVSSLERVVRSALGDRPGDPLQFAQLFPDAASIAGVEYKDMGVARFMEMIEVARLNDAD